VAANVALVAPAATVTDAGAARIAFVFEIDTSAPPVGALFDSAIVHAVDAFWPMLAGAHDRDDTPIGARRLTLVVLVALFRVAVTVAL